jgi:hypothetical protein
LVCHPKRPSPEPRSPKTTQKPAGHPLPDPEKCPGKSLRPPGTFFKTKKLEATSNESSTNSVINERHLKDAATILILNRCPRQLHKKQPFAFINFSIAMGDAKIAAGVVLKFLGGGHTQKKNAFFAASSTNKFSLLNATKNF